MGSHALSTGESHGAQVLLNKENISSDAEKSTQLLLNTTAFLRTQGGRMGKQEETLNPYTLTEVQGQLHGMGDSFGC